MDPLHFERDKVQRKIDELLNLDINKKVFRPNKQGQPSCDRMMCVICLDTMLANEARDIKTFSAGDSSHCYKRLSTGVNMNAPEQYQNIIRHATADCPGATNIADDIVRVFNSF